MRREGEGWRLYRGEYPGRPRGGDRPPLSPPGATGPLFFLQGLRCKFGEKKLHFGPVALWEGDRGIFLKFSKTDIYFWNFNFFKYKKEKTALLQAQAFDWPACRTAPSCRAFLFLYFSKIFFTEIYFQYHILQFCTPTARQGGGRGQGACRPAAGRQGLICKF